MGSSGEAAPLVSVVVATRNRLDWLRQCVDSVRSQRGVTHELIVIDDASTDGTAGWLAEASGGGLRFHRFDTGRERCTARNQGLAMAHGRYVMFLDDDDWLWPGALAILARALEQAPDAVAAVGARWAVFTGENYERRDAHPRRVMTRRILDELLFGWSSVSGQNLYRASVVRAVGGYEDEALIPCEDRLLWCRIALRGSVVLVPDTVMSYRYHAGQSRPPDIRRIRDRVARRAIRATPRPEWRRGLRLRCSGHCIERAEEALSSGNTFRAIRMVGRAVRYDPGIFTSPLIGEWVFRRLAGRLYRRYIPARNTGREP